MNGLRVLIANSTLATRTGTETYVRDLAFALQKRGHSPIVYSPELGEIAREIRKKTIPVIDELDSLSTAPDVIHGNHNTVLMSALLHFPGVPGIFCCHSWTQWFNVPPRFPRILRYAAVDDTCRDRLVLEHGIDESVVRVTLNSVDLERFKSRAPLPARPQRALVFSNTANESTHLRAVREVCDRARISLDVMGREVGASNTNPETVLGSYDLVFAKARCALESMAVGTAVVLCDMSGSGPLVTTSNLDRLRRLNFGIRTLNETHESEILAREIERYDPLDAAEVSRRIRQSAGLDSATDEIISLYHEVIDEYRRHGPSDLRNESRAAAAFVQWLGTTVKDECRTFQEDLISSSLTLRLRNQLPRFPLIERMVKRVARSARRQDL